MWYQNFPKSTPRAAKGGIKAQSKRGAFGQSWWAKRWITTLESFDIGARLGRGRSYARKGQALDIEIGKGSVRAKVQGSSPRPYAVSIEVKQLSADDWEKLAEELSKQAIFTAKLLAGEMPDEIESAFEEAGLSLFPKTLGDLTTDCACPDWSNPCKHIAAVYYLLGEEFDRDPFLLFKLRGLERAELLGKLGAAPAPKASASTLSAEPLPDQTNEFWKEVALPPEFFGAAHPPPLDAALPKRLGGFPFWRGETPFQEEMARLYQQTRARDGS
jgi:uncharacterized Zn finger protein